MKHVFILGSPYQLLLSCILASDLENTEEKYMFFASNFKQADVIIKAIRSCKDSPFDKIWHLNYMRNTLFGKRLAKRLCITPLTRFIRKNKPHVIYVFNDGLAISKAALHVAKKVNKDCRAIYVEDGANAYSSYKLNRISFFSRLLRKLFYGLWWEEVLVIGCSRYIDEVKACLPELLRPELRSKKTTPIPRKRFLDLGFSSIGKGLFEALNVNVERIGDINALLFVADSEFANGIPAYRDAIQDTVASTVKKGFRLGIKYHPREKNGDFLLIDKMKNVMVIPQAIPAELLLMRFADHIKLVIGDLSTALITAKFLLSNVDVVSMMRIIKHEDEYFYEVLKSLGIIIPNTISELVEYKF